MEKFKTVDRYGVNAVMIIVFCLYQRLEGWFAHFSVEETMHSACFHKLRPPDNPEDEGHPAGWGGRSGSDGAAQRGVEQ